MLGGFRSPGTQRGREGGIDDSRDAKQRRWRVQKVKSQRNKPSEKKERNKGMKGCRIRVRDGESVK